MVKNEKVNINLICNWVMAGFSRGQAFPVRA